MLGGSLLIAALAVLLAGGGRDGGSDAGTPAAFADRAKAASERPNIIFLMADDLGLAGWERAMPRTRELLARGTEFEQAIVSTPLCCPFRASFLSGRYGHNNGVLENDPGYPALRGKRAVLPVRLQAAGYRTALVGKFMNGWSRTAAGERGEPAPGWDEWVEMRRTFGYYDYELNTDEGSERHGDGEDDYLTDVLTDHGIEVIDDAAGEDEPLFLWMSWWAPHPELSEATPGPCQGSAIPRGGEPGPFAAERLRQIDSVDEDDIDDKPAFLRERRDLRPGDRMGARTSFRCRLASLTALDQGVERIVERLDELGELDDTVLIFASDNGFFHLEHRIPNGKALPYEEAVRVPLTIELPAAWGSQPQRTSMPASSIDLAPTILALAGACRTDGVPGCRDLDGRSLLPLLSPGSPESLRDRPLLIEAARGQPCAFSAVRTDRYLYAEYGEIEGEPRCPAGQRELYDLREDPNQTDNLLHVSTPAPPAGVVAELRRELRRLQRCSGRDCDRVR